MMEATIEPSLGLGWGSTFKSRLVALTNIVRSMVCQLHPAWVPTGELMTRDGHGLLLPKILRTPFLVRTHLLLCS